MDEHDYDQLKVYEILDAAEALASQLRHYAAEIQEQTERIVAENEVRTLEHWWSLDKSPN